MFNKIVAIDYTGTEEFVKEELEKRCKTLVMYNDYPNQETIIERAKDADALLVSWNTPVTSETIKALPNLKYVGMCCSLIDESSSNVHIPTCKANNITVKGVRDYGDEGVVEFIFSELIRLVKGLGPVQYQKEQIELGGLKLGIVGMGTLGKMVAQIGQLFGMDVSYYSRSKKDVPFNYLPLNKLLESCDIISLHLPRNTHLLNQEEFDLMPSNRILVNTGLTPAYDLDVFNSWLDHNFAIVDNVSKADYKSHDHLFLSNKVTGFTKNARKRLAYKVIGNIDDYFMSC